MSLSRLGSLFGHLGDLGEEDIDTGGVIPPPPTYVATYYIYGF